MKIAAVIVAAGKGLRLGGPVPKQYQPLAGEMVLTHTIRALRACRRIRPISVVIHRDARSLYEQAVADLVDTDLIAVNGGAERSDSVRLGLEALIPYAPDRVLIHDAARPFVSEQAIAKLCETTDAALLAEPVVDALWREAASAGEALAETPVPRAGLWRAQTPQAFPFQAILDAHLAELGRESPKALDDAEVFRKAGHKVRLIEGEADNFKITTATDLERARKVIAARENNGGNGMETRIGQGFDVHQFDQGDAVWLCGVKIPHSHMLKGHSDADVGLHALADAIYGALAEGDIGTHFPPSDPQWKGAESHVFLRHAANLVKKYRGRIVNTDLTLLCEAPKILPHAAEMRARLAEIMEIEESRISIKATTMERMGFIGREEGMGCMANVSIEVPG